MMNPVNSERRAKWLAVQRRTVRRKSADGKVVQRALPCWYGRMRVDGRWRWFRLFTDKRSSQKRWEAIVAANEQKQAGVITPQMEAARRPLAEHVGEYYITLKRLASDEHYRIAKPMLDRLIALAGWKSLSDINEQSASRALATLAAEGKTVAYVNQYLARVKAFLNWCVPDRVPINPLGKLKRGNTKKGLKRRERRPLAEHELRKLLTTCPESRRLKYAFPAYSGLRRKELADVRWADLHLNSVIPYVQLRPEQTKMGEAIALPLHPYLVSELKNLTPRMPELRLFSSLPEGRTMLRDLERAGINQTDASGRRADFHALRHTFAKRLDESGCSHATRRALMRHGTGDQTDGYTLARLSELYEAVKRLPARTDVEVDVEVDAEVGVEVQVEAQTKTGTDMLPLPQNSISIDQDSVVTMWTKLAPQSAATDIDILAAAKLTNVRFPSVNLRDYFLRHARALSGLSKHKNRDIVVETRPRSSVG